jgi:hypothetical protein
VKRRRSTRPHLGRAGVALVPFAVGGYSTTAPLTAAAGISLLVLVLVSAAVALGAAFGRSAARQQACLKTLETLLRLAPWTRGR